MLRLPPTEGAPAPSSSPPPERCPRHDFSSPFACGPTSHPDMNPHPKIYRGLAAGLTVGFACASAQTTPNNSTPDQTAVELSPFLVEENATQGYYASQTLAGGRMKQNIKDIGSSIQVITK